MRLKIDHQFDKEDLPFIKEIKDKVIYELASEHLSNLLEHESNSRLLHDTIRADFLVITYEQAKRLIDLLPSSYRNEGVNILKEEIPALNIPTI